jgi:hypothetical protein
MSLLTADSVNRAAGTTALSRLATGLVRLNTDESIYKCFDFRIMRSSRCDPQTNSTRCDCGARKVHAQRFTSAIVVQQVGLQTMLAQHRLT